MSIFINFNNGICKISDKILQASLLLKTFYSENNNQPLPVINSEGISLEILNKWLDINKYFNNDPEYFIFVKNVPKTYFFKKFCLQELIKYYNFAISNQILQLSEQIAQEIATRDIYFKVGYQSVDSQEHEKFYILERKTINVIVNKLFVPENCEDCFEILHYSEKTEVSLMLSMTVIKYLDEANIIKQPKEILQCFKYNPTFNQDYDKLFSPETIYVNNCNKEIQNDDLKQIKVQHSELKILTEDNISKNIIYYEIPNSVVEIADKAFKSSDIIEIKIPKSVKKIGYQAFEYCKNLETVFIDSPLTEFEDDAFNECNVKKLVVPKNFDYKKLIYTGLLDNLTDTIFKDGVLYHVPNNFNYTIPEEIKIIEENSFKNCFDLYELFIPRTVETVNYHAFNGCYDLTIYTETNIFDWAIGSDVKEIIHL